MFLDPDPEILPNLNPDFAFLHIYRKKCENIFLQHTVPVLVPVIFKN